jgi:hypothetical protein
MGVQVRQVASTELSEVILEWAYKNIAAPQIWAYHRNSSIKSIK